jgi:hypothetical protein
VLLFCLLNTLNEKRFITLCIVVISRAFLLWADKKLLKNLTLLLSLAFGEVLRTVVLCFFICVILRFDSYDMLLPDYNFTSFMWKVYFPFDSNKQHRRYLGTPVSPVVTLIYKRCLFLDLLGRTVQNGYSYTGIELIQLQLKVIEWRLYGPLLEIEWILIIHNNCIFPYYGYIVSK